MRADRPWAGFVLQFGLLAGTGLAFFGGVEPPRAEAAPACVLEQTCTFVKPLVLIVVDYSTSMNTQFAPAKTRWQATVEAIHELVDHDNGYLQGHAIVGLMRFGHDPKPAEPGTTIAQDVSQPPIVDGQAIDVAFYDAGAPDKPYYQCNGDAIKQAWAGPPNNGMLVGIGTWTKGALDSAYAQIQQAWSDHPDDPKRRAAVVLITDGEWTNQIGTMKLSPADQNPAITADAMFTGDAISTYVIAIGEATGKMFADQLASAGGTGQAIDASDPAQLSQALQSVADDIDAVVIAPVCSAGLPRVMVLLDASSSMLNVNGGMQAGPMGLTGWDQARDALAGASSLFDQFVNGSQKLEAVLLVGLAVFGHNMPAPGEQKLLVDYGPCRKDNFAWALDPQSSCVAPGCDDPWGGPPITWTFRDGSLIDPPGFPEKTVSHMPRCDAMVQLPNACVGSGTYTHLGLQLVDENIAAHKLLCSQPKSAYPCTAETRFVNIVITDGIYNSTDAQVQGALEVMYAKGITTYVIGFGDIVNTQAAIAKLTNMAAWGSGGTETYFDANNQMQLEAALAAIVAELSFDPCCAGTDCYQLPPPPPPCCGNGYVQDYCDGDVWYEECDDGNNVDGDGCSATCLLEPGDTSTSTGMTWPETSTGEDTTGTTTTSGGSTTGEGSTTSSGSSSSGEVVTTGDGVTTSAATTGEAPTSTGDASTDAATTGPAPTGEDGCGCATGGGGSRLFTLLALGLAWRRRR